MYMIICFILITKQAILCEKYKNLDTDKLAGVERINRIF